MSSRRTLPNLGTPHPDAVAAAAHAEEAASQAAKGFGRGRPPTAVFGSASSSPQRQPPVWQPPAYGKASKPLVNTRRALCFAPIATFLVAALSFTFLWSEPLLPVIISLLAFTLVLRAGVPSKGVHEWGLALESLLAIGCGLMAVVGGMITGTYAYEAYAEPFLTMSLGRSYHNVLASFPGAAYADAGKLQFASSSQIDSSKALGYRDIQTYCVAPILDGSGAQTRAVSFWAVGTNCCGWRGDFTCHDAGNADARSGVRAADDGVFVKLREKYMQAASQAAAEYSLTVAPNPIFVHWVADPTKAQWTALLAALGVDVLGTCVFGLLTTAVLAAVAIRGGGGAGESAPLV